MICVSYLWSFPFRFHHHDSRGLPGAVEDGFIRPVRPEVERERAMRRWQPVAFFVLAWRCGAGIKSQRTVRVGLEGLVLRSQRIALQWVSVKEMLRVI